MQTFLTQSDQHPIRVISPRKFLSHPPAPAAIFARMKSRFQILTFAMFAAFLSGTSLKAQLPKATEEDEFVSYRQAPILRLRELDYMQSYRQVEADYKRDAASGEYVEDVYVAYVDAGWLADGKRQGAANPMTEKFRIPGRSRKVKLIRHETSIFAKITSVMRPIDGSDLELKAEGMYEMVILEGNWEKFEQGDPLKLALSPRDTERFSSDQLASHQTPRFLAWNASNFREMIITGLKQNAADPAAPPTGITPAQFESVNVIVAPEYREQGVIFTFEGDHLLFNADEVTTTMQYRSFLPPKDAAGAGDWRERYGFVTTPQSFYLSSHGGNNEKPVHEALPKARWPGW